MRSYQKTPSVEFYAKNIRQFYDDNCQNREGANWYNVAHGFAADIASKSGYDLHIVCGVIAALSPQNRWEKNLFDADQLLADDNHRAATYTTNKEKALHIKHNCKAVDDVKDAIGQSSKKCYAFFHNLLFPFQSQHVTIDRHAVRVACYDLHSPPNTLARLAKNSHYDRIAEAFKIVSFDTGMLPHELQAATWVVMRDMLHD